MYFRHKDTLFHPIVHVEPTHFILWLPLQYQTKPCMVDNCLHKLTEDLKNEQHKSAGAASCRGEVCMGVFFNLFFVWLSWFLLMDGMWTGNFPNRRSTVSSVSFFEDDGDSLAAADAG